MRALSKIEQILPPRLGRRVAALQGVIVTPPRARSTVDARTLSAIASACRDLETLRFRYRDHVGTASARCVEPHRLVHTGRRWYLVAWDSDRKDWRTFRVDRIQPRLTAGPRFAPRDPPARDLAAYVARGVWYAPPCRARIKLLVAADVAAERLPPCVGLIEPIDQHSCLLDIGASTFENLAVHLVMLGVDFELTEPLELVEQVRLLTERYRLATAHLDA
jgi:predicted DNA-binding transcriptional regulator YafY